MTRRQPPLIARIMNWACGYRPWDIDEWNEDRREQERQRLDNEEQEFRIELLRRQEAALAALAQSDAQPDYEIAWNKAQDRIAKLEAALAQSGLIEAAEWRDLLSASPADYWDEIVTEIYRAREEVRHAMLLNHQAAHLLAWARVARDTAIRARAADRSEK